MIPVQYKECRYFPCTFVGQSCKHCYCPLYPCRLQETGGNYIQTQTGHDLWDCTGCKVIHQQEVVELLNINKNETDEKVLREAKEKLKSYLRGE